jgi:CubicO group peptidase (beta-lactamase class C family)
VDEQALRGAVTAALDRWPTAGLAVAILRSGEPVWLSGHGVADTASRAP